MAKKRLRARLGNRGAPSRKERRMILNVSSRTDIVHYYTPWFLERLREGRAIVPNPEVPDHAMELDLSPESVQGIVFCSKDYRPLLPHLARLAGKWPVYCHYTITPYGRDVEPGVPDVRESMATLRELSRIIGRERVAWRYDPVLVNGAYPVQRHMRDFTAMAGILAPFISLCVFSFVDLYGKCAGLCLISCLSPRGTWTHSPHGSDRPRRDSDFPFRPAAPPRTIHASASATRGASRRPSSERPGACASAAHARGTDGGAAAAWQQWT